MIRARSLELITMLTAKATASSPPPCPNAALTQGGGLRDGLVMYLIGRNNIPGLDGLCTDHPCRSRSTGQSGLLSEPEFQKKGRSPVPNTSSRGSNTLWEA